MEIQGRREGSIRATPIAASRHATPADPRVDHATFAGTVRSMTRALAIRDAELFEIPLLEALQLRASVVAPDYREALAAHPEAIHLPAADVSEGRTRVACVDERVAGFSVVLAVRDASCELDGLFVEPDLMGQGVGRALIDDVVDRARPHGVRQIDVIANPTAVCFYSKVGFVRGDDAMTQFGPAFWMHLKVGAAPDA
jgi:GNAT superfamily N-acetyltransferase